MREKSRTWLETSLCARNFLGRQPMQPMIHLSYVTPLSDISGSARNLQRRQSTASISHCVGELPPRSPRNWIDELLPTCKPEKARPSFTFTRSIWSDARNEEQLTVSNEFQLRVRGSILVPSSEMTNFQSARK